LIVFPFKYQQIKYEWALYPWLKAITNKHCLIETVLFKKLIIDNFFGQETLNSRQKKTVLKE